MKYKINEETKQNTISLTIAGCILLVLYFLIRNFELVETYLKWILKIIMPFILGFGLAFIIKPFVVRIENLLQKTKLSKKACRQLSTTIAFVTSIIIFIAFLAMIIPQLGLSLAMLYEKLPDYANGAMNFVDTLITEANLDGSLTEMIFKAAEDLVVMFTTQLKNFLPAILSYSWQVTTTVLNFFIGIAIAIYIILDNERFHLQAKKVIYAIVPKTKADLLVEFSHTSSRIFTGFIIGKAIDSFIIGIICFIGMTLLQLPYALLISVVIGVTNMIPVFGPFIGAVPGVFILFIVDPTYVIWFIIFIFLLQQFDGNILGPLILGDSLGLPSLWIMFSIIVGGGMFGIVGMFLGVPLFALFYLTIKTVTENKLKEKNIQLE